MTGELAVLRIVADEVPGAGVCDGSLAEIAARAGVCRTLAHSSVRLAARLGLVSIEERRRPGRQRNLTNIVRVTSREWGTWLAKGPQGKGVFRKMSPPGERESRTGYESAWPREKAGIRGRTKPSGPAHSSS
jgi:hypothetical protein